MTLISAQNLSRYYGSHCAVNDVSFTLEKGEVLGFLGPNGAGKTTTMQMICGNLAPSSGQITINGFDLLDQPKQAKQCLGYLPDTPPLYKDLTVTEFLHYCAQLHGIRFRNRTKAITTALQRCGLEAVSDRLIANLSKGYQQRIGIAQAIIHEPDVIVLDEPTVGLDPIQIKEIRTLIKQLGQQHGIILSTHILPEVQESCTHVQIIHQGQLIFRETIQNLNQRMNKGVLKIVTRETVDNGLLSQVSGVTHVETSNPHQYTVYHDFANNPTEQIAALIVNAGWGLLELTPIKKSIEDVFIALTTETHHDSTQNDSTQRGE